MEYRFKLVIPEKKAERIEKVLNWDKTFDYENKLNLREKIEFPINLKDGKKIVLFVQGHDTEEDEEEYGGAWSRIYLYNENGDLLAKKGLGTRNFFREWILKYNEDIYIINTVREK